jgi:eukaryotic-like serine/threonine-protein kinase
VDEWGFGLIAGRYRLKGQLGRGAMGRVWLAHDEKLGRHVAIKEVAPSSHQFGEEDEHLRAFILREAKAAARITHPNVVKIHDVIETEGWPWLVMEYVPSVNLQRTLGKSGPLPPAEVARVGLAVLEALVAAHEAGVLHRDVKPENVLLSHDGRVVLGDFGLARIDADGKATVAEVLGTPQFLAPERARHGTSSREADLWSLGATLYSAVEGRSPYERDSMLATLSALAADEPDPMRRAGPLEPVIAGLLKRDPADRTKPEALARQLRRVRAGRPVEVSTAEKPGVLANPPRGRRVVLASVATAALIAGGVAFSSDLKGTGTSLPEVPPGRPVPATGIPGCEMPRGQISPPAPGQLAGGPSLPEGWMLQWDPAGFTVAVPAHWAYWRLDNSSVCFKDPGGNGVMGVVPFRPTAETLPDYREIAQKQVPVSGQSTEWEFTYTWGNHKRHAIAIVTSTQTVFWITDDADFAASRPLYEVVRTWFSGERPGPAPTG